MTEVAARRLKAGSSVVLALTQLSETVLPLARSVVLARLLPQEDFGIAVGLSTVAAMIEIATDLGFDRSLMRAAARGEVRRARATLHTLTLLRGLATGLLIMLAGPLTARLLHASEASLSFSLIGAACVVRGLAHLGLKEMMQDYVFWPESAGVLASQVCWTLACVAWGIWLHDYRAMLVGIIAAQLAYVAASHLFSHGEWRLGWNEEIAREALGYGAPLIPNGIGLVINGLLDRVIVGAFMGARPLAIYSTTIMTATMPRGMAAKFLHRLALPVFVNHGIEGAARARLYDAWAIITIGVATILAAGFASLAGPVLKLVWGPAFEPSHMLTALIALDIAPKFLTWIPTTPAAALGRTGFILQGTIASSFAMALATAGIAVTGDFAGFVGGMCVGETLALFWILWRTTRLFAFRPALLWPLLAMHFAVIGGLSAALLSDAFTTAGMVLLAISATAVFGAFAIWISQREGLRLAHLRLLTG